MTCGACGEPATCFPYSRLALCRSCKDLAAAWCWQKLQGIEREHVLPRHDDGKSGQAYLCILCGYWHWTSNEREPSEGMSQAVWALCRYFERTSFHINIARGWARICYLPVDK